MCTTTSFSKVSISGKRPVLFQEYFQQLPRESVVKLSVNAPYPCHHYASLFLRGLPLVPSADARTAKQVVDAMLGQAKGKQDS